MRTDDLIATLSGELEPVKTGTVTRILLGAVVLGLAGSVLVGDANSDLKAGEAAGVGTRFLIGSVGNQHGPDDGSLPNRWAEAMRALADRAMGKG